MHDVNAGGAAETHPPLTASAVLVNPVGLHARPSVKLTQCAKTFSAKIEFALAARDCGFTLLSDPRSQPRYAKRARVSKQH